MVLFLAPLNKIKALLQFTMLLIMVLILEVGIYVLPILTIPYNKHIVVLVNIIVCQFVLMMEDLLLTRLKFFRLRQSSRTLFSISFPHEKKILEQNRKMLSRKWGKRNFMVFLDFL